MRLSALLLFLAFVIPGASRAQNVNAPRCGGFDTTTFSTTPMAVLMTCNVTTGPAGIILADATAEVQCGAQHTVQMFVGVGTSPVTGSNFLGQISGGVLTVASLIPGFGSSPWLIGVGQTLSGSGFVPMTITGLGTGSGGTGAYTVSNGAVTTGAGLNMYTLSPLPEGLTPITPAESQTGCQNGFIITSISGNFTGLPNTAYYVAVQIATSNSADQANWNNNGISLITY